MGTRYAVVKGVTEADSAAIQAHVTTAGGTFIRHDLTTLNFDASFDTDAQGAAFATLIVGSYTDIDWDPLQALNVGEGKV